MQPKFKAGDEVYLFTSDQLAYTAQYSDGPMYVDRVSLGSLGLSYIYDLRPHRDISTGVVGIPEHCLHTYEEYVSLPETFKIGDPVTFSGVIHKWVDWNASGRYDPEILWRNRNYIEGIITDIYERAYQMGPYRYVVRVPSFSREIMVAEVELTLLEVSPKKEVKSQLPTISGKWDW